MEEEEEQGAKRSEKKRVIRAEATAEFTWSERVNILSFLRLIAKRTNPRCIFFPNRIGPDGLIKVNDFTQNPRVRLE